MEIGIIQILDDIPTPTKIKDEMVDLMIHKIQKQKWCMWMIK